MPAATSLPFTFWISPDGYHCSTPWKALSKEGAILAIGTVTLASSPSRLVSSSELVRLFKGEDDEVGSRSDRPRERCRDQPRSSAWL